MTTTSCRPACGWRASAAATPNLVPDNSHSNTTYISDGVHPTQAGADEIAAAVAVEVDAIAA